MPAGTGATHGETDVHTHTCACILPDQVKVFIAVEFKSLKRNKLKKDYLPLILPERPRANGQLPDSLWLSMTSACRYSLQ